MNKVVTLFFISIFFFSSLISCKKENIQVDILIKNGIVYDGISESSQEVAIAILKDKIIYVGDEKAQSFDAKKTIDAKGLIVCPGFIDPHTHADRDLNDSIKAHNHPFLMQGITTVVVGNDGDSFFPIKDFKNKYQQQGIGTNAVLLTGHGTIRKKILGASNRPATEEDIEKMKAVVQMEMEAGAFGISTGLFYAPGSYSNTDEVIELAKVVAEHDGIYDTHLRDESSFTVGLIPAVEEAIKIGQQANLPIHISHIKCLGVDVWNQSEQIIDLVQNAKNKGISITANQYPYDASATSLKAAVIPRWAESGGIDSLFLRYNNKILKEKILLETTENITRRGGPERLLIVRSDDTTLIGKNLLEVSNSFNQSPAQAVVTVLKTGYIGVVSFNMQEKDIKNYMRQDWVVTGSDGNSGHPRKYGSFPRMYHKYVQTEKVIDIGTFIKKSTALTADIFKIPNRGSLAKNQFADIIIFHPNQFKDKADYADAFQLAEGLVYSIINGKLAVDNKMITQIRGGKVLEK